MEYPPAPLKPTRGEPKVTRTRRRRRCWHSHPKIRIGRQQLGPLQILQRQVLDDILSGTGLAPLLDRPHQNAGTGFNSAPLSSVWGEARFLVASGSRRRTRHLSGPRRHRHSSPRGCFSPRGTSLWSGGDLGRISAGGMRILIWGVITKVSTLFPLRFYKQLNCSENTSVASGEMRSRTDTHYQP